MSKTEHKAIEREWECDVPADVVSIATSMGTHRTMVGTLQGVLLIDGGGSTVGEVAVEGQVDRVKASDDGRCFGVLTKEGDLHGFSPKGEKLWQIDVEGASDFDLGRSGDRVALAVPPYSVLVAETGDPDASVDLTFQHEVATLALLETDNPGVVAAGHLGELSRENLDGELAWKVNAGLENGPMRMSHAAERVAIAVQEEGYQSYSPGGEEKGIVNLEGITTAVVPALGPNGPVFSVLSGENCLIVFDEDGQRLCERQFETLIIDYDFSDDASILSAGGDDHKVYGFRMPAGDVTWMVEEESKAKSGESKPRKPDKSTRTKRKKQKTADESGVPRPKGAEVLVEIALNDDVAPRELDQMLINPDGTYAVSVVPRGVIAVNAEGEVSQELDAARSSRIARKRNNDKAFVWNNDEFIALDWKQGTNNRISFEQQARLMDCTADGRMIAVVNERDELVIFQEEVQETCRRKVSPAPVQLHVSPGGSTILTRDSEGRFRFFNKQGEQQRKQRISGESDYNQVILEEGFCALGGSQGRVIVHEMSGKVLWTKRVAESVDRMGSLENTIAVYSNEGVCMVMNPYGEVEMEFEPPPGLSKLRWPEHGDPLLVHARRDILTTYGGYSRKLNAKWSFRCEAPIRAFDVDRNAHRVLIAAGEKLYLVEGPQNNASS